MKDDNAMKKDRVISLGGLQFMHESMEGFDDAVRIFSSKGEANKVCTDLQDKYRLGGDIHEPIIFVSEDKLGWVDVGEKQCKGRGIVLKVVFESRYYFLIQDKANVSDPRELKWGFVC